MAYTNRGDFLYSIMKGALDNLTSYDSKVKVADSFNTDYPYVMLFVEDEHYTYEDNEGQLIVKARGESTFNIYFEFKIKTQSNSDDLIRTTANQWVDEIEYVLRNINLKQNYTHSKSGTEKYVIVVKKIKINDIIKALASENDKVGTLYINGTIEFDKNYVLT